MSTVPTPITYEMQHYIDALLPGEDHNVRKLLEKSYEAGLPAIHISHSQARFMQVFLRAMKAKNVLEIGTLGGYSASIMAQALPADGKVISLEMNKEYAAFAKKFCDEVGAGNKVEIKIGAALDILPTLEAESFDFIFIDADKENYEHYLEHSLRLVRRGGVIAADNALAFGLIADEELSPSDPDYNRVLLLRKFNKTMASHPQLLSILASIGDGMHIGMKL